MHLFLTGVLPFLAHNHASAAAFLTCRHHNFHASIIPEFLSDEEIVRKFYEARQQNELEADCEKQYTKLYNLFVQTPLMQFSPSLMLRQDDCVESILSPLLATKYFSRTLQRCSVSWEVEITNELVQALSKVQLLTKLEIGRLKNEHLEIIINSFPSLETLSINQAQFLELADPATAIRISSPPSPATIKTLRNLELRRIDPLFATQFVPQFPNLRKLMLLGQNSSQPLDLLPLLPLLKDISLEQFDLKNTDSLNNLVHLSSATFGECEMPDSLSFLTQENCLPELTTLRVRGDSASSFASLCHASNLHVLQIVSESFDNDCLQYLGNMVHLRQLTLISRKVTGAGGLLKTLLQNSFHLEELNLGSCRVGGHGAFEGVLYTNLSRLRVLNLDDCGLGDDDLNGIGALKNTLEVLDLSMNSNLTTESLMHCKDLVKLKTLNLLCCDSIDDLSPLTACFNLEELNVAACFQLTDDSFQTFIEDPNSFPSLRVLDLSDVENFTEKVLEHLSKNNHLVYQLKELNVRGVSEISSSSSTARNKICQLKALQRLYGILPDDCDSSDENTLKVELMQKLKNLEEVD